MKDKTKVATYAMVHKISEAADLSRRHIDGVLCRRIAVAVELTSNQASWYCPFVAERLTHGDLLSLHRANNMGYTHEKAAEVEAARGQ